MATTGDYYINLVTGQIQQQTNPVLAAALLAADYEGPYPSIAAAKAAHPQDVSGQAASAASSATAGLSQIGSFFAGLSNANTWIRVAKVVVGGLLLIIGLVHITGVDNAAANVARKVPLPV